MKERLTRINVMLYAWQIKKIKEGNFNMSELMRILLTKYFEENDEVLEIKEKELSIQLEQVRERKAKRDKRQQEFLERNKGKAEEIYKQLIKEYLNTYKETKEFLSNDVTPDLLKEYARLTGTNQIDVKNQVIDEIKKMVDTNGN